MGQVQGVGFRPFIYRLACRLHLSGLVRNDDQGVLIEAQGDDSRLRSFERQLRSDPPPLARIQALSVTNIPPVDGETEFRIEASEETADVQAEVTVDAAVCPECLNELLGTTDRRAGYGLINCTHCGPRFTIVQRVPYDRPNTTMAGFAMCPACRAEYENPGDRRFHAQPVACHACGPQVALVDNAGRLIEEPPYPGAARRLRAGQIVAIKGLGGFHLACEAGNAEAVALLRKRKVRDSKPFALMVRDIASARLLVALSERAEAAMLSPACPIVLAPRKAGAGGATVALGVADGMHRLGVMLPYTPMQHLLFAADAALGALVMTSANVSDEPLVIDNADAVQRLGGLCDAILWHNRAIERAVDDSVMIDMGSGGEPLPVRRARGYVPGAIELPVRAQAGLAVGGELKDTIAVVREGRAILSHHLGDLTHAANYECFRRAICDMRMLFGVRPEWIAHDLHPLYLSSSAASDLASELGVESIGVQHHHAHAAALLAEYGMVGPVLAVICDGVGYGSDGNIWGGELLVADLHDFKRIGHLEPMLLAGGDAAARDTRRCGLALLQNAFGEAFSEHPLAKRIVPDAGERDFLVRMLHNGVRCVPSTAAGRVFDGVAALLGVCSRNTHEAEAAMKLEALASGGAHVEGEADFFEVIKDQPLRINLAPLVRELANRVERRELPADLAAFFHRQFAAAWARVVQAAAVSTGLMTVALSGGVFCNEILTKDLSRRLQRHGLTVLRHRQVPPNDGGIALGQAAIAAARLGGL